MKWYKHTRKAWEWSRDKVPKGELKKVVTRIERRKLQEDTDEQVREALGYKPWGMEEG